MARKTHHSKRCDSRPLSPAIKPGSREEYLWNHPEEVDRILREHGVNLEEIERVLDQGGGVIFLDYFSDEKNRPLQKTARS